VSARKRGHYTLDFPNLSNQLSLELFNGVRFQTSVALQLSHLSVASTLEVMGRLDHLVEAVYERFKDRYFKNESAHASMHFLSLHIANFSQMYRNSC
jgi:hypothetical protein